MSNNNSDRRNRLSNPRAINPVNETDKNVPKNKYSRFGEEITTRLITKNIPMVIANAVGTIVESI